MINRTPRILALVLAALLTGGMSPFDDPAFENLMGRVAEKYCVEQHFRIYKYEPASQNAVSKADVDSATCRSNYALENDTALRFYDDRLQHTVNECVARCRQSNAENCRARCDYSELPQDLRLSAQTVTLLSAGCRGVIHEVLGGPVQAGFCSDWKFKPSDRLDGLVAHADRLLDDHAGNQCLSNGKKADFAALAARITPVGMTAENARTEWTNLGASCQPEETAGQHAKRTLCRISYGSFRLRGDQGIPLRNRIDISLIENADGTVSGLCAGVQSAGL